MFPFPFFINAKEFHILCKKRKQLEVCNKILVQLSYWWPGVEPGVYMEKNVILKTPTTTSAKPQQTKPNPDQT